MARQKDNVCHIVGVNGENNSKEIEIDLSFVTTDSGYIILEKEKGFQQQRISKAKNKKMKVTMKPNGGFVAKI